MVINVNEMINKKVNAAKEEIVFAKKCRKDLVLVKKLFGDKPNVFVWISSYDISISWLALSIDEVKGFLRRFAESGVMLETFRDSSSTPNWRLTGLQVPITLMPDWNKEKVEGATCRLVQTGTEISSYPTYKLICE